MSQEAIGIIVAAEEKARGIRADAAAEAKRMVSDANSQGKKAVADAVKKAENELAELTRKADEKAKDDAVKLARTTENKKAGMRAKAEGRLDDAAGIIVERIVRSQ